MLWEKVVSYKKGCQINSRFLQIYERRVGHFNIMQVDLNEAKQRVKDGYRRYYSLKKIAKSLQESWIMDLTAIRAKNEDLI